MELIDLGFIAQKLLHLLKDVHSKQQYEGQCPKGLHCSAGIEDPHLLLQQSTPAQHIKGNLMSVASPSWSWRDPSLLLHEEQTFSHCWSQSSESWGQRTSACFAPFHQEILKCWDCDKLAIPKVIGYDHHLFQIALHCSRDQVWVSNTAFWCLTRLPQRIHMLCILLQGIRVEAAFGWKDNNLRGRLYSDTCEGLVGSAKFNLVHQG